MASKGRFQIIQLARQYGFHQLRRNGFLASQVAGFQCQAEVQLYLQRCAQFGGIAESFFSLCLRYFRFWLERLAITCTFAGESVAQPQSRRAKELRAVAADSAIRRYSRLLKRRRKSMLVLTMLILSLFVGTSFAEPSYSITTEHLTAQLVAEHSELIPGKASSVALKLIHQPQWHSYWRTPGDSGLPTQIKWEVPTGVEMGGIQWPAPQRLPFGPLVNFGYDGEVWLITELRLSPDYDKPSVTLTGRAEWLVCSDVCIPEQGELRLTLPVAPAGASLTPNPAATQEFERTRARLPRVASEWVFSTTSTSVGSSLLITPPAGQRPIQRATFYPYDEGLIEPSAPQSLAPDGEGYRLEIVRAVQPLAPLNQLRGFVVLEDGGDTPTVLEISAPVTDTHILKSATTEATVPMSLVAALLLAFGGGIILNLMPCVFPVLSIKVLSFARETDQARTRRHGLFYSVGVIASFWLLAALLLGLRAAGHELGWGFQLQSPLIVASLALLFFVLALNLSGLFEFGSFLPSALASANARHPDVDALLTGGLAVAIASPCTGPFMAAALGYAITQPGWTSFAVFTSLGLGMALPYFLLAWFPRGRRLLPRPGAWMQQLRQFLAFPLFATVIWLAWVLGMQAGVSTVIDLLLALWLIALSLWLFRGSRASKLVRLAAWGLALIALVPMAGIAVSVKDPQPESATLGAPEANAWDAYSQARVEQLMAEGKTVFVDFTAAWCVTCQVNKKLVLETEEIDRAFAESGIVKLRADWTNRDPAITRALTQLGRSGVPVYLIQRPGQPPELLPELLTKTTLRNALMRDHEQSTASIQPRSGQ